MDVRSAYLDGDFEEQVSMQQPQGFVRRAASVQVEERFVQT